MSRGLGHVQRRVMSYLNRAPAGLEHGVSGFAVPVATNVIADVIFYHRSRNLIRKSHASAQEIKATQRALRSLEQRGLVVRAEWRSGQQSSWRVTKRW